MTPGGGGAPEGYHKTAIDTAFGSVDQFKQDFTDKAKTLFGSGWTWLAVGDGGALEILQTKDADLPLAHGAGDQATLALSTWHSRGA